MWTVHTKECHYPDGHGKPLPSASPALAKPVGSPAPHLIHSTGASKGQVPVGMLSPETSSLLFLPVLTTPPPPGLPLNPAAPPATCSGSRQTAPRQALRGPGRVRAPPAAVN